jgi:hypothetical protein
MIPQIRFPLVSRMLRTGTQADSAQGQMLTRRATNVREW